MMGVSLTNDGPVTLTLDSRKFEYIDVPPAPKGVKSKVMVSTPKIKAQEGVLLPVVTGSEVTSTPSSTPTGSAQ
jgi:hypothetical protein